MSKKPSDSKKPAPKKEQTAVEFFQNFVPPPGFVFPGIPGFPETAGFEKLLRMKPLPGREEEFEFALSTIRSIIEHDFNAPIDQENVCGHKAPGVEMKEGYCLNCYEEEKIEELSQMLDLSAKFGPEVAAEMMTPTSTSGSAGPSTSGQSSSSSSSAAAAAPSGTQKKQTEKKTDKTTKESEKH